MQVGKWKRVLFVALSGGVLFQAGGCLGIFGPDILSLGESVLLTYLFGRGP
jgi:hypothetical protein